MFEYHRPDTYYTSYVHQQPALLFTRAPTIEGFASWSRNSSNEVPTKFETVRVVPSASDSDASSGALGVETLGPRKMRV